MVRLSPMELELGRRLGLGRHLELGHSSVSLAVMHLELDHSQAVTGRQGAPGGLPFLPKAVMHLKIFPKKFPIDYFSLFSPLTWISKYDIIYYIQLRLTDPHERPKVLLG